MIIGLIGHSATTAPATSLSSISSACQSSPSSPLCARVRTVSSRFLQLISAGVWMRQMVVRFCVSLVVQEGLSSFPILVRMVVLVFLVLRWLPFPLRTPSFCCWLAQQSPSRSFLFAQLPCPPFPVWTPFFWAIDSRCSSCSSHWWLSSAAVPCLYASDLPLVFGFPASSDKPWWSFCRFHPWRCCSPRWGCLYFYVILQ